MSKKIIKQEDIELLIRDLSARLLYDVIVQDRNGIHKFRIDNTEFIDLFAGKCNIKPFLRTMSSMTKEEKEELKNLFDAEEVTSDYICYLEGGTLVEYLSHIPYSFCSKIVDWFDKNMFDHRGLIPKGLAIAVTKENNPYKN